MSRQFFVFTLLCGLCWPLAASPSMQYRTEQRTINPTPVTIGTGSKRLCVTVKNRGAAGTASVFCGPCPNPRTEDWELPPGEQYTWGANYKETFSAEVELCCASATGDQDINVSEEGLLIEWTPTPTNTPTNTPTP